MTDIQAVIDGPPGTPYQGDEKTLSSLQITHIAHTPKLRCPNTQYTPRLVEHCSRWPVQNQTCSLKRLPSLASKRILPHQDFPSKCKFDQNFELLCSYHQVGPTGEICVNTLKKDWTPDLGIRHILLVSENTFGRMDTKFPGDQMPAGGAQP